MATTIQVEYWKNQETMRHNKAAENQAAKELAETARHNYRTEGQTDVSQRETARHNRAQEDLGSGQLAETTRHNQMQEGLGFGQLVESRRHNQVSEYNDATRNSETVRHNQMTESLTASQLAQLITEQDRRYGLDAQGTVKFNVGGQTYTVPADKAESILKDTSDSVGTFTKKGFEWLYDAVAGAAEKGQRQWKPFVDKVKKFAGDPKPIHVGKSVTIGPVRDDNAKWQFR